MLASYFLSRTVVPTMAKYLLVEHDAEAQKQKEHSRNPFIRFQLAFERRFEQFRSFYHGLLGLAVAHSTVFLFSSCSSPWARSRCSIPGWGRTSSLR